MTQQNKITITGKITSLEPKFSSAGKLSLKAKIGYMARNFSKEDVFVEFPIKAFGKAAEPFSKLNVGDIVRTTLIIEPQMYDGKAYLSANLLGFETAQTQPKQTQSELDDDIPF